MKVTVAIDSFKGSLTTFQAGEAVKNGIKRVYPDAEVAVRPIADGGEGTVDAVADGRAYEKQTVTVSGPLGAATESSYIIIKESKTAFIEMSAAAGITLIDRSELNPMKATTYGVGQLISDAILKGCRNFIVGIGGSATNDGGAGMLSALGFDLLNADGEPIALGGEGLSELDKIETQNVLPELYDCTFKIACDVRNPLCGESGCSAVFGPQKGATANMIKTLDLALERFASLTLKINPKADPNTPGAGAAGGIGYAFLAYLNAALIPGIDLIMEHTNLEEYIKDSDIVITGEGRLDGQSHLGKAPTGVAKLAKKHGKKVIAFSGCVTDEAKTVNEHGIDAFFPILKAPCSLDEAMDINTASKNMADTAEQVFRLIKSIFS